MNYLEKLIEISSVSLDDKVNERSVPKGLEELFLFKNGFLCFEGACRFFPISNKIKRNLFDWNEFVKSKFNTNKYIFFADNVLGDGFCLFDKSFYKFDFETGEREFMGDSLLSFSKELLLNYNYYTGHSLAKEWQDKISRISFDEALMPKIPFVLGGEYQLNNLYLGNVEQAIKYKKDTFDKVVKLKDGDQIKFIY